MKTILIVGMLFGAIAIFTPPFDWMSMMAVFFVVAQAFFLGTEVRSR